ncbi:MAG: YceI family protein [Bacteroidetes bacterium]|nr:MAG: YceI family protein [Bacteroidota bacterium]
MALHARAGHGPHALPGATRQSVVGGMRWLASVATASGPRIVQKKPRRVMNRIRLSLPLVLIGLLAVGWISAPVRFTFQPGSRIWIEGTSSLHDWTCEVNAFDGAVEAASESLEGITQGRVTVPVTELACKNGTMNKKAYQALAAEDHPTITYTLKTAALHPSEADGTFRLETLGALTIAGTTRDVAMTVDGEPLADGRIRLTGRLPLRMTDFGVDPPTAMLGTLKTGDEVTVHFDVVLAR